MQLVASEEEREKDKSKAEQVPLEGHTARTSKQIGFFLLFLYGICLVGILFAAIFEDPASSKIWFDIFKSGFLLLGGALTTIIGYYFGSAGIREAEAIASTAMREANAAKAELENEKRKEVDRKAPTSQEETGLVPAEE